MTKFQELYSADIARYGGKADLYITIFHFLFRKAQTVSFTPIRLLYKSLFRMWASKHGLEISINQRIGPGFYIGHAYNITINNNAQIGCNCNVHKGIVIGKTNRGERRGTPSIGDRVWIGINSAIVGNVTIGNDVLIAPNSFVNIDIPSHSIVFGNPCIIKHRDWATEGYVNNVIE